MDIKELTPHYTISVNETRAMVLSEGLEPFCDALNIEDELHSKAVDLRGDSNFLHYYFVFSPALKDEKDRFVSRVEKLIPEICSGLDHEMPADIFMAWGLTLKESHRIVAAGRFLGLWEQINANLQMPTLKWEYKEYMDLFMCNFALKGYIKKADVTLNQGKEPGSLNAKEQVALMMNKSEKVAASILSDLAEDGLFPITKSVRKVGYKETKRLFPDFFEDFGLMTPTTLH